MGEQMPDNVVELNSETLYYIPSNSREGGFDGVGDSAGMIEFVNNDEKGTLNVFSQGTGQISKEKFKSLCIAWLALNYPDVIKFDDE
jgi:hypothetical protein